MYKINREKSWQLDNVKSLSDFYTIRSAIEKKISDGSKEKDIIGQLQMYLAFWQICS